MALPFLRSDTEEEATQTIAFVGIAIMTVGLTIMNVTGAIAGSEGVDGGRWLIRGALAVILSGAELLAAVALVRVMLAPNNLRKVVGSIIFIGLAWACIQNGKRAVHLIYPEFRESATLLEAKAAIAKNDAAQLADAKQAAIDATPAELEKVRTRIAELEAEQRLMASQSPEKIKEAQALLIAQGKYFGQVDGIRKELTEAAMRSRGEEIRQEMDILHAREVNLSGGIVQVAPVLREAGLTADTAALKQVELEEMARKAAAATIWLEVMLWVFEGARSFGLWALVAQITNANRKKAEDGDTVAVDKARLEELEQREKAAKEGGKKAARTRRRGNKIASQQRYAEERIDLVQSKFFNDMTIPAIAKDMGLTVNQLRYELEHYVSRGWMEEDSFTALFGVPPSPAPQRPEADDEVNGYALVLRKKEGAPDSTQEDEDDSEDDPEDETGGRPIAAE